MNINQHYCMWVFAPGTDVQALATFVSEWKTSCAQLTTAILFTAPHRTDGCACPYIQTIYQLKIDETPKQAFQKLRGQLPSPIRSSLKWWHEATKFHQG